eukprot:scaffold6260_cov55-Phaeocystis_antarctica.AAC.2
MAAAPARPAEEEDAKVKLKQTVPPAHAWPAPQHARQQSAPLLAARCPCGHPPCRARGTEAGCPLGPTGGVLPSGCRREATAARLPHGLRSGACSQVPTSR